MTGKKITGILLAVLLVFVGFLTGLLVGRRTTDNMYFYSPEKAAAPEGLPEPTYQAETVHSVYPTQSHGIDGQFRRDLNAITKEELMEIPGIGEVLAQRILDFRQRHGLFYSVDELAEVEGIGEKRLEDLHKYLFVEDKR